jgi:hypothetical protein
MDMSDRGMSHTLKDPGVVENVLTGRKKCVGEVSLHFLLQLNILGVLNLPTDRSLKGLRSTRFGAVAPIN